MVMRQMRRPTAAPCGHVLLATLAIVAVLSGACATIALSLDAATRTRQFDAVHRLADDLLLSADRLIEDWLAGRSRSVVLSPGVTEPDVEVYDGELHVTGLVCHISISARDIMGERPVTTERGGALNVNTATAPLLRELFTAAGRDDAHHVLIARSKGRPAPIVGSLTLPGIPAPVRLVGSSEAWTMTTAIVVDQLVVRWQARYELEHGQWVLQSRRRVTE
jgi:hypothetical protein